MLKDPIIWRQSGKIEVHGMIDTINYLVGGLEHFICSHILRIIIPTLLIFFQRGRSTTNQLLLLVLGIGYQPHGSCRKQALAEMLKLAKHLQGGAPQTLCLLVHNPCKVVWYICHKPHNAGPPR